MRTKTKTLKAVILTLSAAFLLAACGYGSDIDDDTGLGGGGSGGGGDGPNDTVCDEVLDRMTGSMNDLCADLYDFCCVCICWNHNQVVTGMDEEYCYCGDPPGGQVRLSMNGECEGDTLAWAQSVLDNNSHREKTEDMIVSQCSSSGGGSGGSGNCAAGEYECACGGCVDADYVCDGDPDCTWECGESSSSDEENCGSGGGGGDDCHSTGRIECSSGILWPVYRCDDGTEYYGSENFYECPCGCYHGASYCNMC